MTTKQFETAINSAGGYITIDEMKLHGNGQVHEVLGHTSASYIVWDEFGRGYSVDKTAQRERFIVADDEGVRIEEGYSFMRDDVFDLNFE